MSTERASRVRRGRKRDRSTHSSPRLRGRLAGKSEPESITEPRPSLGKHAQQQLHCIKTKREPQPPVATAAAAPTSEASSAKSSPSLAASASTSTASTASVAAGQDKRYTGLDNCEVRCLATTTRGRACAYIGVQGTKYCYLHADYETNPPPRRKSKEEAEAAAATAKAATVEDCSEKAQRQRTPVAAAEASATVAATSDTAAANNLKLKRLRRSSAKLAEKHADSPHPLLSMIATDNWFGTTVKIATGPLEGRTGVVEKWGNGWISAIRAL